MTQLPLLRLPEESFQDCKGIVDEGRIAGQSASPAGSRWSHSVGLLSEDWQVPEEQQVLQSMGCCFAGKYKTRVAIAFVMLTEVPLRVWSWGRSGWDHLVLTDVNWISTEHSAGTDVFLTNMASVIHGGLISVVLSAMIIALRSSAPNQLSILKKYKDLSYAEITMREDMDLTPAATSYQARKFRHRIGWILLGCGILGTIGRTIVSIGNAIHYSVDSPSSFQQAFCHSILNGETRFRMFIVIPQQALLGVLTSCAVSQVAVYILLATGTVHDTLRFVQKKLQKLEKSDTLKPSDLNVVANILLRAQCMFDMLTEFQGIGLLLITALMFPIFEFSFWIFVLAELQSVGEDIQASTRGLAFSAVESCVLCLGFLGFFMYTLSKSTSACDSILGKFQKLRIRNPVGMDETEELISPKDVQEKITFIEMYVRGLNGGGGMGLCILGQRMSLGLFKTLIIAYASVGTLYLPKALAFFQ